MSDFCVVISIGHAVQKKCGSQRNVAAISRDAHSIYFRSMVSHVYVENPADLAGAQIPRPTAIYAPGLIFRQIHHRSCADSRVHPATTYQDPLSFDVDDFDLLFRRHTLVGLVRGRIAHWSFSVVFDGYHYAPPYAKSVTFAFCQALVNIIQISRSCPHRCKHLSFSSSSSSITI